MQIARRLHKREEDSWNRSLKIRVGGGRRMGENAALDCAERQIKLLHLGGEGRLSKGSMGDQ